MVERTGMLNITPELEAEGRGKDTEVGFIEVGSIVIPEPIATDSDLSEMFDSLKSAIEMQGQNPKQFTVTPDNELYAYSKDNAIRAHLTNGEFIVPVQVLNAVPDLQEQLSELFTNFEVNINQYTVGHEDNKINPDTGLPEFFIKKLVKAVRRGVKSVGKAIKRGVDGVVDFGKNFVKSLGQGVEDLFKGDIDAVLKNPAVITTASFMFPAYAPVINLGSKAVTGQKITTADLVSAGFSASTNFANVKIDPKTVRAVTTAAQIADGTDPVQALASNYGANWLDETGIGDNIKSGVRTTVGDQYADRIFDNIDINQAVADYSAGKSTERILANQFGDEVVGYLGAESPSQQALGYAGIETAVQKAEGASDKDALLAGAQTYYDRGGKLPDAGQIASLAGFDEVPEFDLNEFVGNLGVDFPDLKVQGYDLPSLAGLGIDLNQFNLTAPDILDLNMDLPQVAGLGVDLGQIDFSGVNPLDLGVEGFDIEGLEGLQSQGIDVGSLDLGDLDIPQVAARIALAEEAIPGTRVTADGDEIASLTPDLDFEPQGGSLARKLLKRTFA